MTQQPVRCPRCKIGIVPGGDVRGICPTCMLEFAFGEDPNETRPKSGIRVSSIAEDPMIGRTFGPYEIEEPLGRGGMGVVYRARHTTLGRTVAIKVLPEDMARDPAFTARFHREARALASLSHPHIVGVHDFGCIDGRYYFAMEYVDGPSLRTQMRDRRITPERALEIVPQLCDALQYAHRQGVVHRDIKPENILLDAGGMVKIADFGLAKIVDADMSELRELTRSNMVMGTLHYMAPEQVERPREVDHRADIYSLGVVYYEMLTGELPLGRFDPPSRRADIGVSLDDVVLKTLEKQPERRYQQAREVKDDTERASRIRTRDARGAAGVAAAAFAPGMDEAGFLAPTRAGIGGDEVRLGLRGLPPDPSRIRRRPAFWIGMAVAVGVGPTVMTAKAMPAAIAILVLLAVVAACIGVIVWGARQWSARRSIRGMAALAAGGLGLFVLPCAWLLMPVRMSQMSPVPEPVFAPGFAVATAPVVRNESLPGIAAMPTDLDAVGPKSAIDAEIEAAEAAVRAAALRAEKARMEASAGSAKRAPLDRAQAARLEDLRRERESTREQLFAHGARRAGFGPGAALYDQLARAYDAAETEIAALVAGKPRLWREPTAEEIEAERWIEALGSGSTADQRREAHRRLLALSPAGSERLEELASVDSEFGTGAAGVVSDLALVAMLQALGGDDPEFWSAVWELRHEDAEHFRALFHAVFDGNAEKVAALEARHDEAQAALADFIQSWSEVTRNPAEAERMRGLEERVRAQGVAMFPAFVRLLEHAPEGAFHRTGEEPFTSVWTRKPTARDQVKAIFGLAWIGRPEALPVLAKHLEGPSLTASVQALEAFEKISGRSFRAEASEASPTAAARRAADWWRAQPQSDEPIRWR